MKPGKDGKCEDSMLEQDSQKNEMEIGAQNSNITEWEMVDESCRMEPRTQLKIQNQQQLGDQEKDGKTTSTNSSNWKKK